jgi:hypothetical protein
MIERAAKKPRLSEKPHLSDQGRAREAETRARLAEALRENLKKRKAQAHGRIAGEAAAAPDSPGSKP